MDILRKFENNPCGKSVGDCAVRTISAAMGLDWYEAYALLCAEGRRQCDMPNADAVWGAVLFAAGFHRYVIADDYPDRYTAMDFAIEHSTGTFVLAFGGHVAAVIDGQIWDSWDSSREIPVYYYANW